MNCSKFLTSALHRGHLILSLLKHFYPLQVASGHYEVIKVDVYHILFSTDSESRPDPEDQRMEHDGHIDPEPHTPPTKDIGLQVQVTHSFFSI